MPKQTPARRSPLWTLRKIFSPTGLSIQIVWFDDLVWPDGPTMFRKDEEVITYILCVLYCLGLDEMAYSIVAKYRRLHA